MQYSLIRQNRKSISVSVDDKLNVVVKAPFHAAIQDIESFLSKHSSWIKKQKLVRAQDNQNKSAFTFSNGDTLPFLGEVNTIEISPIANKTCQKQDNKIIISETVENREHKFCEFLCDYALDYLPPIVYKWGAVMNVHPTNITITYARTRWGSCSGKNAISLSYHLLSLPPDYIEAIIVHELAHITHHNHSPQFYTLVEQYIPNQKAIRLALKDKNLRFPF